MTLWRAFRLVIKRWLRNHKYYMIEAKLYQRLKTVAANVYPLAAPLNYALPAVIYQRVSTDPERDIGDDAQDQSWVEFQVDTYSRDHVEAETLARTIRTSLKAWQDSDVAMVAYTNHHASVDNTTDVQLFRVMAFYRMFVND